MIYGFFDSNLFQTIVLILTVIVTIWVYYAKQRKLKKNAATILLSQIKEIEENIEFLLSECIINGNIQERPIHYSAIVYNENNWSKYSHLVIGNISTLSYEKLDEFFKVAAEIREQQIYIKNKIQLAIDSKSTFYYAGVYTIMNNTAMTSSMSNDIPQRIRLIKDLYNDPDNNVMTFIQMEFALGLEEKLKKYHKLTDGMAYYELKKMSK